jgi:hypothetical protein
MTDEVDLLTSLELVSEDAGSGRQIEFLEPNLAFEIQDATSTDVQLRVWFELELRPPWARAEGALERDLSAKLSVSRYELASTAADLRAQRKRFPDRLPRRG